MTTKIDTVYRLAKACEGTMWLEAKTLRTLCAALDAAERSIKHKDQALEHMGQLVERLEAAEAALDAAEAQNRKLGDMVHKRGNDLAEVRHQLKRAEAEKRAAVTLLQEIATSGRCDFQKVRDTLTAIRETNDG
jgi:uncharacterized protein YPO0396